MGAAFPASTQREPPVPAVAERALSVLRTRSAARLVTGSQAVVRSHRRVGGRGDAPPAGTRFLCYSPWRLVRLRPGCVWRGEIVR